MRDTVFNNFSTSSFEQTGIKFGSLGPLTFLLSLSSPNPGDNKFGPFIPEHFHCFFNGAGFLTRFDSTVDDKFQTEASSI